jgi:hypothetical protein
MDPHVLSAIVAHAQVMQVLLDTLDVDRRVFYERLMERRPSVESPQDADIADMYDAYVEFLRPYEL